MKTSFVISHNTRIQCLLDSIHPFFGFGLSPDPALRYAIYSDKMDEPSEIEEDDSLPKKIRFQNCVILKLVIGPEKAELEMIYSGELNDKEKSKVKESKPYFISPVDFASLKVDGVIHKGTAIEYKPTEIEKAGFIEYKMPRKIDPEDIDKVRTALKLPKLDDEYVFYLIRHGQAKHNETMLGVSKTFGLSLDTSITDDESLDGNPPQSGKYQAKRAGEFVKQFGITIDEFFVSDLIRTKQTADAIQEELGIKKRCIVLPCASELSQKGEGGSCDQATSYTSIKKKIARENYPSCTTIRGIPQPMCSDVDWNTVYLPFYGGKVRGEEDTVMGSLTGSRNDLTRQYCRDTTMISMAVYYYLRIKERQLLGEQQAIASEIDSLEANTASIVAYINQNKSILVTEQHAFGGRTKRKKRITRRKKRRITRHRR